VYNYQNLFLNIEHILVLLLFSSMIFQNVTDVILKTMIWLKPQRQVLTIP